MGPLTNLTWGGEGGRGIILTEDKKRQIYHDNNRTKNMKESLLKFYQTERGKKIAKEIGISGGKTRKGVKRGPYGPNKARGRISPLKGKKYTEEEKDILYESRRGIIRTDEQRNNYSEATKKYLQSEKGKLEFKERNKKQKESLSLTNKKKLAEKDKIDPWITYTCEFKNCKNETTMRTSKYNKRLEKYKINICTCRKSYCANNQMNKLKTIKRLELENKENPYIILKCEYNNCGKEFKIRVKDSKKRYEKYNMNICDCARKLPKPRKNKNGK